MFDCRSYLQPWIHLIFGIYTLERQLMTKKVPTVVHWNEKEKRGEQALVPILRQTLCQLSGAKGCDEQIKQFWGGNCSAPNQIYLHSPLRRTDVLSAKDFNSLHWDADKQPDGALQRLRFLFNCVFFPLDLFLANPRPSWRKSPFPPPLSASSVAACHGC